MCTNADGTQQTYADVAERMSCCRPAPAEIVRRSLLTFDAGLITEDEMMQCIKDKCV